MRARHLAVLRSAGNTFSAAPQPQVVTEGGRQRRRILIRAQPMVRGCQAAAMAPPDRAAGRLTPLGGRRKEPHPTIPSTISPSGPFLFDLHGKRGYIGVVQSTGATHMRRCVSTSEGSGDLQQVNAYAPCTLPPLFRTEKQLTAPADRPVRAPAHAVAFSTGVAAGYDRSGPGSPPPNSPSQNRPPTSPVNHIRGSADHRPAWRCDAGPDVRRAVGVCMMGHARGSHLTSAIWQGTLCPRKEVKMILKEPHARAA